MMGGQCWQTTGPRKVKSAYLRRFLPCEVAFGGRAGEPQPHRMSTPPTRCRHVTPSGFTLVEIMIVVVIIGLLAALAIPAFQRVQRASQNARVINDFRVFSQAFEVYNSMNGVWPNNAGAGAIPALPVPMNGDFKAASWQAV